MIVETTVNNGTQTLKINHGGLPAIAARTMAKTLKSNLLDDLRGLNISATAKIKYRTNSFWVVVKFSNSADQKKLEELDSNTNNEDYQV